MSVRARLWFVRLEINTENCIRRETEEAEGGATHVGDVSCNVLFGCFQYILNGFDETDKAELVQALVNMWNAICWKGANSSWAKCPGASRTVYADTLTFCVVVVSGVVVAAHVVLQNALQNDWLKMIWNWLLHKVAKDTPRAMTWPAFWVIR